MFSGDQLGINWGSPGDQLKLIVCCTSHCLVCKGGDRYGAGTLVNNPTLIGLTQQLKPDLWTWASDPQELLCWAATHSALEIIPVDRLEQFGCKVKSGTRSSMTRMNKDQWNEATRKYGVPKERHIQCRFQVCRSQSLLRLWSNFGLTSSV